MSDIFISYANEDRETAGLLADALEQFGWSVWRDREIAPGDKEPSDAAAYEPRPGQARTARRVMRAAGRSRW